MTHEIQYRLFHYCPVNATEDGTIQQRCIKNVILLIISQGHHAFVVWDALPGNVQM